MASNNGDDSERGLRLRPRKPRACTQQLLSGRARKRLPPLSRTLIILLIALPWHVLATLRNPPYFVFTMRSVPGEYHGFFWFSFMNEQSLRFLNMRYPRDYDTVPRPLFWGFHLLWLFPWSVDLPAVFKLRFWMKGELDRAARTRLLALRWIGFVMVFFTFSTTQGYYSMPIYPAVAMLLGTAMAFGGAWIRGGTGVVSLIAGLAGVICFSFFFLTRGVPAPGDISQTLGHHPNAYKLSLGHMEDLTIGDGLFADAAGAGGDCVFVWISGDVSKSRTQRYWR